MAWRPSRRHVGEAAGAGAFGGWRSSTPAWWGKVLAVVKTDEGRAVRWDGDPEPNETLLRFNDNPALLGLPCGRVLDVTTGAPRDAVADDRVTRKLAVEPSFEESELWLGFLREAFDGDEELVEALRDWCGCVLEGSAKELETFLFFQGVPGTGKSTIGFVLLDLFGDYGFIINSSRLAGAGGHLQWLTKLDGMRYALIDEIGTDIRGKRTLPGEYLNNLVQDGRIEANQMGKGSQQIRPNLGLVLTANEEPPADNEGVYRRMKLIKMDKVPARQTDIKKRLRQPAELARILGWILRGSGGAPRWPRKVAEHVEEYRRDADPFLRWLREKCEVGGVWREASDLLQAYKDWLEANGFSRKPTSTSLGAALRKAGIPKKGGRGSSKVAYQVDIKP